jgi:Terminase large subunit, T4likevirus-type, N-terminal
VSTASLRRDIARLREHRPSGRWAVAEDRPEFARSLGIVPDPWQRDLLRSDAPRVLLNCSRQSGKSTMAGLLALHEALTSPGSLILILAPAERQAKELFSKVAEAYRTLGQVIPAESHRKLGMELANGSRIEALPGTEKTVRGFSGVDLLIVDEAARVADVLYYAVRPMLAVSGGRLLMLSTPFGKRGAFYEEWTGAGGAWERYTVTAAECPRIPTSFLEEERETLGPWWFAQEYGCRFMDTVDQVFATEVIDVAMTDEVAPLFGDEES